MLKIALAALALTAAPLFAHADDAAPAGEQQGQEQHTGMDHMKGHHHHHGPPPPEALAACNGKVADAACSFKSPKGDSVDGKCMAPEASTQMACIPDHMKKKK